MEPISYLYWTHQDFPELFVGFGHQGNCMLDNSKQEVTFLGTKATGRGI